MEEVTEGWRKLDPPKICQGNEIRVIKTDEKREKKYVKNFIW